MDRNRQPPRENNYRPGERYGGRSPPPRRGRTPIDDRSFPTRGGPAYSRGPSPGRPPPRYRSRSPYRPRDSSGSFRPRSPPRGPGRLRSPPSRRYSRSPPPRGPPPQRPSPSTYRPRSPARDGRYSGPRDDRRDYGGPREDGLRGFREASYRPRESSQSPQHGSAPASKAVSANSSRMPSPHIHSERLRQDIGASPVPSGSPAPYPSRGNLSGRRSPLYRPRERSPPSQRSPRPYHRDRPPSGPRDSSRHTPPPRRERSPLLPSRPAARDRSPPKGPASDRGNYRDRTLSSTRDPHENFQTRSKSRNEVTPAWADRPLPSGPRARDEEPRMPPTGPRNSYHDTYNRDLNPSMGPSTPSGPASMRGGSPFVSRGRGGPPLGRGKTTDPYITSSPFDRGRGRGAYNTVMPLDSPNKDTVNVPTGPRSLSSWVDKNGPSPIRPPLRGNHSSSSTYSRTQRFHVHLVGMSQIIEGGRRLPSGLNVLDEKRLAALDIERERLHKETDEKQKKRRAAESEYAKAEKEAKVARLRTNLAEEALERFDGDGSIATAY